jgi:glycosyltransferase involved in cell wall biosynthesis
MPSTISSYDDRYADLSQKESVRILHLVSSGGLYGAEQVILNLARTENTISYVGALYNVHSPNLEVIDEAEKRGSRTVVFDSRGRIDFKTVFKINRFLKNYRIDILHTHGYKSDIVGFLAALWSGTKWVATNHVWHPTSGKLRLYESVDALVLRFAKRIVAVSAEIREDLISTNVPPANIRVIDNGIDLDRFTQSRPTATLKAALGIAEQDVVVTIVGRLSPEKGHKTFLEAARTISSKKGDVKFLIVGDGPMREELRAEAIRLNIEDRVVFAGFRKDMPAIYALSDVLVNASSIEGLPMTILEAMASNVPVIAPRTGGVPAIIKDNETGLLVDAQNVVALRIAIQSLIDDREKRRRLAGAAFGFVTKNHSFERMCDAYLQVYREVMDGN